MRIERRYLSIIVGTPNRRATPTLDLEGQLRSVVAELTKRFDGVQQALEKSVLGATIRQTEVTEQNTAREDVALWKKKCKMLELALTKSKEDVWREAIQHKKTAEKVTQMGIENQSAARQIHLLQLELKEAQERLMK